MHCHSNQTKKKYQFFSHCRQYVECLRIGLWFNYNVGYHWSQSDNRKIKEKKIQFQLISAFVPFEPEKNNFTNQNAFLLLIWMSNITPFSPWNNFEGTKKTKISAKEKLGTIKQEVALLLVISEFTVSFPLSQHQKKIGKFWHGNWQFTAVSWHIAMACTSGDNWITHKLNDEWCVYVAKIWKYREKNLSQFSNSWKKSKQTKKNRFWSIAKQ